MAQWESLFPYSKKVLGFEAWISQELFCVELAYFSQCQHGFLPGYFPPQSKSMQWIGHTKLATVVSVSLSHHWRCFQFWVGSRR